MLQNLAALLKPDYDSTLEYAQQVLERSVQLARSQLEVAESMYTKVSQDYRELLESADSSTMFQSWTKVLGSASCCTSEGVAAAFQNTSSFHNDMIQVAQSRVPDLNKQLIERLESLGEATRAAASTASLATSRASRRTTGDAAGVRAGKAAAMSRD